jgi:hypothetical protein
MLLIAMVAGHLAVSPPWKCDGPALDEILVQYGLGMETVSKYWYDLPRECFIAKGGTVHKYSTTVRTKD